MRKSQTAKLIAASCGALIAAMLGAAAPHAGNRAAESGASSRIQRRGSAKTKEEGVPARRREGETLVNQIGVFRPDGDRIAFHPADGGRPLRLLENLALERIVQAMAETSGQRQWCVSGRVTEYRGENYLLVARAQLKSRHAPDQPGLIAPPATTPAATGSLGPP